MTGLVSAWKQRHIAGADLDPALAIKRRRMTGKGYESVIGGDDRRIVPDVTILPWRPLVCLQLHFGAGSGIGSGILIAPDVILTAAHNLYMLETRSFPEAIVATVGTKNGSATAESRVTRVEVCPGYTNLSGPADPSRYRLDYGIARLADDTLHKWAGSAVNVAAQAPLSDADMAAATLTIAGYPDEGGAIVLKACSGKPRPDRIGPVNFSYEMDSMPGQSGGPVFRWHPDTRQIFYAGVHVAGDADANTARRYDASMRKQLQEWLGSSAGGVGLAR